MTFCARATRGLRRPSLDARSGRSISPHPRRDNSKLRGIISSLVRRPHVDQHGCPSQRGKTSELGGINWMDNGRSMCAVKDGLPAPSGESEESEDPRWTRAMKAGLAIPGLCQPHFSHRLNISSMKTGSSGTAANMQSPLPLLSAPRFLLYLLIFTNRGMMCLKRLIAQPPMIHAGELMCHGHFATRSSSKKVTSKNS